MSPGATQNSKYQLAWIWSRSLMSPPHALGMLLLIDENPASREKYFEHRCSALIMLQI